MTKMRRWYDAKEEAREAARGGGYFYWRVQRLTRVRHGLRWSFTFRDFGPVRWYVALELPKTLKRTNYEIHEEEK